MTGKGMFTSAAVAAALAFGSSAFAAPITIDDFGVGVPANAFIFQSTADTTGANLGAFTRTVSVVESSSEFFLGSTYFNNGELGLQAFPGADSVFELKYTPAGGTVSFVGLDALTIGFKAVVPGNFADMLGYSVVLSSADGSLTFEGEVAATNTPTAVEVSFSEFASSGSFDLSTVTGLSFLFNTNQAFGAGVVLTSQSLDGTPGGGILIIPEPASLALMVLGGLVMVRRR